MAKKTPKTREQPRRRSAMPMVVAVMLVAAVAAIALISRRPGDQTATAPSPAAQSQPPSQTPPPPPAPQPMPEPTTPPALARSTSWPADLPPLPFVGYPPPRPREVVQAVYQFAYRRPDVLDYVPCFCGCERDGHVANTDCFVKSREGDRVTWDDHGLS